MTAQSDKDWSMAFVEKWLEKSSFSPKIMSAWLQHGSAKLLLNKSEKLWNNILWTDESKVEMRHLILTAKHGVGEVMIWVLGMGNGKLAVIEPTINSTSYQNILETDVMASV